MPTPTPASDVVLPGFDAIFMGLWRGLDVALAAAGGKGSATGGEWVGGAAASLHTQAVSALALPDGGSSTVCSVSKDGTLKIISLADNRPRRSLCPSPSSRMALSACAVVPTAGAIAIGSWDNTICFYSVEYSRVLQSIDAHDDSVACIAVGGSHLLSGSWDSSVKLWQLDSENGDIEPVAEFHELETDVRCVAIDAAADAEAGSATMAAAGCADGTVAIFDIEGEYMVASATVSSAAVCAVASLASKARRPRE